MHRAQTLLSESTLVGVKGLGHNLIQRRAPESSVSKDGMRYSGTVEYIEKTLQRVCGEIVPKDYAPKDRISGPTLRLEDLQKPGNV